MWGGGGETPLLAPPEAGNQGALSEAASQNRHQDSRPRFAKSNSVPRFAKSNSVRVPGVKEAHQSGGLKLLFLCSIERLSVVG